MSLEVLGYDAFIAADREAARDLVLSTLPDLALLDVVMPKLDGLSVLRVLANRLQTGDLPVVLLTSRDNDQDAWRRKEAGGPLVRDEPV